MESKTEKDRDPSYWANRKRDGIAYLKAKAEAVKAGRPMNIESPEKLWELACEYFERCEGTPWTKTDYKGKDAVKVHIPTASPFLWSGFEDYLFEKGVCTTLKDYRTASRMSAEKLIGSGYERYEPFSEVIRAIDGAMLTQKLSGALVRAYDSNLVARLEGLVDKSEETVLIKETKIGFE